MKQKNKFLRILLILSLFSFPFCKESSGSKSQQTDPVIALKDSVLAIHDTAMAKMDILHSLIAQLKGKKGFTDSSSIIKRLREADKSMMDWMHQFRLLPDSVSQDSALRYYHRQLKLIQAVSDSIHQVIEEAQEIVEGQ